MSGPIILPWRGVSPKIASDAFIAPNAVIIGDVEIGSGATIWFNCVLRGDVNHIRVGDRTNIQDDTGFYSEKNIKACEAAGIVPLIAVARDEHHPDWRRSG